MQKYVVGWKCRTNGRIGQSRVPMTLEEAGRLAAELNKAHPDYQHVPVPANTDLEELARLFAYMASEADSLSSEPTPRRVESSPGPNPAPERASELSSEPTFVNRKSKSTRGHSFTEREPKLTSKNNGEEY